MRRDFDGLVDEGCVPLLKHGWAACFHDLGCLELGESPSLKKSSSGYPDGIGVILDGKGVQISDFARTVKLVNGLDLRLICQPKLDPVVGNDMTVEGQIASLGLEISALFDAAKLEDLIMVNEGVVAVQQDVGGKQNPEEVPGDFSCDKQGVDVC